MSNTHTAGKQVVDDGKHKAIWDDKQMEVFIKICIQEIRKGNRPTTHFSKKGWSNLQENFNKLLNKKYDLKQFKNKWENLKKDWQLWKKLIGSETGLGWNALKRTIDAPDNWWAQKTKEMPHVVKFREKGLPFPDEMNILFGDVVASGAQAWTPASGSLPQMYEGSQSLQDDVAAIEGSGDSEFRSIHPKILNDRRYFPFFRDCIGALDGTHVKCIVPSSSMARYIGRKGITTQNILAITDWDMCFTYVWAGWEGTAHDSRIFHEARTTPALNFVHPPEGKYYLVDSGYPMPVGYIAPYKKERYHIPDFRHDRTIRNANELFNYYHSSLRCTVERTFGVWKSRFRLLQNMTSYAFETQRDIVIASMTIHNFIRRNTTTDAEFLEYELNEELNPEEHNNNNRNTASTSSEAEEEFYFNQTSVEMINMRDSIRDELVEHHM